MKCRCHHVTRRRLCSGTSGGQDAHVQREGVEAPSRAGPRIRKEGVRFVFGGLVEWLKTPALNTGESEDFGGSNPSPSA